MGDFHVERGRNALICERVAFCRAYIEAIDIDGKSTNGKETKKRKRFTDGHDTFDKIGATNFCSLLSLSTLK